MDQTDPDLTSETKEKPKLPDIKRKQAKNRDEAAVRVQGGNLTKNKTKETKSTEKKHQLTIKQPS